MQKDKLVIASNNAHKVEEIASCIGDKFELLTLEEIGFFDEIEETGTTLEENSLIKAKHIYEKYGLNCLADDSGLEVQILNGEPGVLSARYAGVHGNHAANMDLLLLKLNGKLNKTAQFRTVITTINNGVINQFEGIVKGNIIEEKRGSFGFGYDPIFVPEGHNTTFAEMNLAQKSLLSHRAIALRKMAAYFLG